MSIWKKDKKGKLSMLSSIGRKTATNVRSDRLFNHWFAEISFVTWLQNYAKEESEIYHKKADSYVISLLIYKSGHLNEDRIKTYPAAPLRRNAHTVVWAEAWRVMSHDGQKCSVCRKHSIINKMRWWTFLIVTSFSRHIKTWGSEPQSPFPGPETKKDKIILLRETTRV